VHAPFSLFPVPSHGLGMGVKTGANRVAPIDEKNRAIIDILEDADHRARVHVTGPEGRRFEYVVTDEHRAEPDGVYDGRELLDGVTEPDWMADVLRSICLEVGP